MGDRPTDRRTDRPFYPVYILCSYQGYSINNRCQIFNSSYCAVTTDIQLTIDDKPLILLIAQLTQILNSLSFFLSFLFSCLSFYCGFLLRSYQGYSINNRRQTFISSYCEVNRDIEQQTILLVF